MNKKQSATLIVAATIVAVITWDARYANWLQTLIQVLGTLASTALIWLALADRRPPDQAP